MRVVSLLLLLGCASNPAPSGTLPTAEQVENTAYGGYILVRLRGGGEAQGELLAVNSREVFVKTSVGQRTIRLDQVETMRMATYHTGEYGMSGWGLIGTLSTVSHGFLLVFSAPIWILTTSLSAAGESRRALIDFPDRPLSEFAMWARYPQGMPVVAPPPSLAEPPVVPKPEP
jgi:hypothetical protein